MTVSIWEAWLSASAASSSRNSTSSWESAASCALAAIWPSQPWSVGGTLATMVIFSPAAAVTLVGGFGFRGRGAGRVVAAVVVVRAGGGEDEQRNDDCQS